MGKDAAFFEHFDEVHRITCQVVRQIPDQQLDFKPVEPMWNARDLVFHMFSQQKVMLGGCRTGKIEVQDFVEVKKDKADLKSARDLAQYGEQVHREMDEWVRSCSQEEYQRPIEAFFGHLTPFQALAAAEEHLIHHRGQLYVYLRLMGIEPLFVFTGEPVKQMG